MVVILPTSIELCGKSDERAQSYVGFDGGLSRTGDQIAISGEIEIVAAEDGSSGLTLVFCEVKCRSGLGFGHPLEAITYTKMRTLRQLAALWMREHRINASTIRLDAIGVVLISGQPPSVTHVRAVG
jgi:putative endonuclease